MVNKIDGNRYYVYEKPKKMNIPNAGEKFSLGHEKEGLQAGSKDKNEVSGQEKQQAAEQTGVRIELSSKGVEKQRQAEAMEHANVSGLTPLRETIRIFFTAAVAAIKDIFSKIWNEPTPEDALKDISGLTEAADAADALESTEAADAIGDMESPETAGIMGDMESSEAAGVTGDMKSPETVGVTGEVESPEAAGVVRVAETMSTTDFTGFKEDTAGTRTDEENVDREIRQYLQNGDMEQMIRLLTDNGRKTAARNSTLLTYYDKNGRVVKPDASVQQRTLYGDRSFRRKALEDRK